jgi:aminotransferase EvaB
VTTLVWNYLPECETERDDIIDAVETVSRSGWLILGNSVRGFEEEYAAYHGVPHCVGVDSGTNAIKLGLRRWESVRATR